MPPTARADDSIPTVDAERARAEIRIDQLNLTAEQLGRADPARAERLASEAFAAARDIQFERGRIEALHNLGRIARLRGQLQAASGYLVEALTAAEALGEARLIAKVGNSYGAVLERQGLDAEALDRHQRVQALWRDLDDLPGLIASSINIARVFERRQAWNDAQRHYEAALQQYENYAAKDLVPAQDVAAIWMGQGRIALGRGLVDQAEYAFTRALDLQTEHRDVVGESAARTGLARVAAARGEELGAVSGFEQALNLATRVGARAEMVEALAALGHWHLGRSGTELSGAQRRERLQRALDYTQRALQLLRQGESDRTMQIGLHRQLADIHELQGDNAQALTDLKTAHELRERQYREQNEARYALLANAANMRERERELLALRAASEQQAEILAQETLLKHAFAAAMILLAGIAVLLTVRFVESRRAARERTEANARLADALRTAEQARSRAEEADRVKTEMLGIAAHDLRNPLTVVLGYVQILSEDLGKARDTHVGQPESTTEYIYIIEKSIQRCRDLIDTWQDLGRKSQRQPQPLLPARILAEIVKSQRALVASRKVSLDLWVQNEECQVLGDATQLSRAIQNILGNAIEALHEQGGRVEIRGERKERDFIVTVRDDGVGITPENLAHVFEPYFTTKSGKKGTGLGLFITRKIIEDHRGRIEMDSRSGEGTRVTISLPLWQDAQPGA